MSKKNKSKKVEKKEVRKIPTRNYIVLLIMVAVTVALTLYVCKWIDTIKDNKYSTSPLSGNVNEVSLDELSSSLAESPEVIIYFGYVGNESIYKMEEKLSKTIEKEGLRDLFMYVNISDFMINNNYLKVLKAIFKDKADDITKAPMFIYYKDGVVKKVINSNGTIVDSGEIGRILDTFEIEN